MQIHYNGALRGFRIALNGFNSSHLMSKFVEPLSFEQAATIERTRAQVPGEAGEIE